ncbi:hypothetical protein ACHAPU_008005 [Fusarium lateritium]
MFYLRKGQSPFRRMPQSNNSQEPVAPVPAGAVVKLEGIALADKVDGMELE